MLRKTSVISLLLTVCTLAGFLATSSPVVSGQSPYRVEAFGVMSSAIQPYDGSWGDIPGIAVDKKGTILIVRRAYPSIVEITPDGKVLKAWGTSDMFGELHGLHVDRDNNIWVTDAPYSAEATAEQKAKGQRVLKFSRDGKLLMTLGKAGVMGDGPDTFNQPSQVVTAPNGDVFVADGHGGTSNGRIVRFSKDGKFITAWGKPGKEPGEFNAPHAIALDSQGRVFVADRANQRMQIFDQNGKLLDIWKQFGGVSGLQINPDDTIIAGNASDNSPIRGIVLGNAKTGAAKLAVDDVFPECIVVNSEGTIYIGEAALHRTKQPLKRLLPVAVPAEVNSRSLKLEVASLK